MLWVPIGGEVLGINFSVKVKPGETNTSLHVKVLIEFIKQRHRRYVVQTQRTKCIPLIHICDKTIFTFPYIYVII